jgi:REP element-mobilizing transposase RayT
MASRKSPPQRRSNRLGGYDYALAGAYFVTIVAQGRWLLFGDVVGEEVMLNATGEMILQTWLQIPEYFPSVDIDEFIVMPNHFHGIAIIHETIVGAGLVPARDERVGTSPPPTNKEPTLGDIIRVFKSMSTNRYISGVRNSGWPSFERRLWQRNYRDRIIRDEDELHHIREYIHYNPLLWAQDEENPDKDHS